MELLRVKCNSVLPAASHWTTGARQAALSQRGEEGSVPQHDDSTLDQTALKYGETNDEHHNAMNARLKYESRPSKT